MSRNWALGLVSAAIWVVVYVWYFLGIGQVRRKLGRGWSRMRQRLGLGPTLP